MFPRRSWFPSMMRTAQLFSWRARERMSSMPMRWTTTVLLVIMGKLMMTPCWAMVTSSIFEKVRFKDYPGWCWPPSPPPTLPLQRARTDPGLRLDHQQVSDECQRGKTSLYASPNPSSISSPGWICTSLQADDDLNRTCQFHRSKGEGSLLPGPTNPTTHDDSSSLSPKVI